METVLNGVSDASITDEGMVTMTDMTACVYLG